MAFTYVPDFIIKRKRKRCADVDDDTDDEEMKCSVLPGRPASPNEGAQGPVVVETLCAISPQCIAPHVSSAAQANPGAQHHRSPTSDSLKSHITVDDFLRWSAQTPKSRYGQSKRHRVHFETQIIHDDGHNFRNNKSFEIRAAVHNGNGGMVKRSRVPQCLPRRGSMASRLLNAAILAHVDPDENGILQSSDAHTPNRPSLKFLYDDHLSPPGTISRSKKRKLIDPRKTAPYPDVRSAFIPLAPESPGSTRDRKPVSRWKPRMPAGFGVKHTNTTTRIITHEGDAADAARTDIIPLTLIPLEEHEALLRTKTERVSDDVLDTVNRRYQCPQQSGHAPLPMVALSTRTQCKKHERPDDRSEADPSRRMTLSSMLDAPLSASSPAPRAIAIDHNELANSNFVLPNTTRATSTHPASVLACNEPHFSSSSSSNRPPTSVLLQRDPGQGLLISRGIGTEPPDLADKSGSNGPRGRRLRPLASFLDAFRERARAAAQIHAAAASQVERSNK
ncbi:uncharacterized protein LAESUDRAFT_815202 [Laetiporus sulphureus 93-53]|uniref:Uncharacterized protein n=1 Tax=Laetiporus sulphureus 93-53 TaxID=1314785 RepID=A0A165CCD1_9APHY|nr:uncharacterized protein LAESUDRAFT_815202 [Laetiporus sulphureus 93-53]KZT02555.1 hypothetical protein LAESUDRAFT_815202 [Laetiporus sulphureus 93-53]